MPDEIGLGVSEGRLCYMPEEVGLEVSEGGFVLFARGDWFGGCGCVEGLLLGQGFHTPRGLRRIAISFSCVNFGCVFVIF